MVKENLNREIVKKSNHTSASFIVLTLSLGLLFMYTTTAVQWTQILTPAHAATTNSTEQAKSAANQTGEAGQSLMNKTGEFLNKTGEFFKGLISSNKTK